MSYIKREEQIEIALIPKNNRGEYIRVARIIPEGGRLESVDIRIMYTDDSDDIRPTKKGVRVNSEQLPEFVAAVLESLNQEEKDEAFLLLEQAN